MHVFLVFNVTGLEQYTVTVGVTEIETLRYVGRQCDDDAAKTNSFK
jgi:hypothetical protein